MKLGPWHSRTRPVKPEEDQQATEIPGETVRHTRTLLSSEEKQVRAIHSATTEFTPGAKAIAAVIS